MAKTVQEVVDEWVGTLEEADGSCAVFGFHITEEDVVRLAQALEARNGAGKKAPECYTCGAPIASGNLRDDGWVECAACWTHRLALERSG